MPRVNDFRTGRHVVYDLQAHLVLVPKYRRAVINERVFAVLRTAWAQVCEDFGCELRETGWEADHVHEVRSKLWGSHFWSPSYCAVSCGGAPLDIVKRYI